MCRNGHPDSERKLVGGRMKCGACVKEQWKRRQQREKDDPLLRRAHRAAVVCPAGCRRVCLCEDL